MRTALVEGQVFDGDAVRDGLSVVLEEGRIAAVVPAAETPGDVTPVSLEGGLLAPGFVDVQVNGGGGVLVNDAPSVAGIARIAGAHRRFGTTSLLPTLITDDWEIMVATADAVAEALKQGVPGVRGVHFEGPFLNAARKGVHSEAKIRPLEPRALELFRRADLGVVVVTLAPEAVPPGTIAALSEAGVRVCAGHTAATYEEIAHARDEGLSGYTHLFNAMSPLQGRMPGVVGAGLDDREGWCGLIVDGYHVHPASMRIAVAAKARGKMMLVTDAMPTVGASDPRFVLNGETIEAVDGRCATADGTLAGSDLDMASAVRNTVTMLGLDQEEALRMASTYPAAFLGLNRQLGRIAPGYDADLVLLDDKGTVRRTWIGGEASGDKERQEGAIDDG